MAHNLQNLLRIAELVRWASGARKIKDWQMMHLYLSEAAELAEQEKK